MSNRAVGGLVVLVIALTAFAAGTGAGAMGLIGIRPPTLVGDGIVGENVATLWADGTAYGARSSVAWTDEFGSEHDSGWPACLAAPGDVTGVKFAGSYVWHGDSGIATILWVDCR